MTCNSILMPKYKSHLVFEHGSVEGKPCPMSWGSSKFRTGGITIIIKCTTIIVITITIIIITMIKGSPQSPIGRDLMDSSSDRKTGVGENQRGDPGGSFKSTINDFDYCYRDGGDNVDNDDED